MNASGFALARVVSRSSRGSACKLISSRCLLHRAFHISRRKRLVKPFLLADIGEGITECQLTQWFVRPGARVEQFDKLCEVQSDKASVEITSPFDGVITRLYHEPDDMAITGKPLVDIDIQGVVSEANEKGPGSETADGQDEVETDEARQATAEQKPRNEEDGSQDMTEPKVRSKHKESQRGPPRETRGEMSTLATPAVRHLTKEMNVRIEDIAGTGKDGRVLKEDIHRYFQERTQAPSTRAVPAKEDRTMTLTPVQNQMFKAMTRSLNIPHFLYSCSADMTSLTALRGKLNASRPADRVTSLAFILKAVSIAFQQHTLLNASLDLSDTKKPSVMYHATHNFGVAVDTPSGLLVPVIRNVQDLSIGEIAAKVRDLSRRARESKLGPADFNGATFTVSNIGSVGGGVVSPVISEPQVAIVGIGRSKIVPAFDDLGQLVKREEVVLSWSADHRIVDGAECARCAERVRGLLEDPGSMIVEMR